LREIAAARSVSDFQVLAALNIPNIGVNVAKAILAGYTILELSGLSIENLSEINGIGPERAGAIFRELAAQQDFLNELLECVEVKQTKGVSNANLPKICFTGKMPEQRSYYEELARQKGFEPVDAVTQELSLLVAADVSAAGGKLDKARKADIQIISLDDWLKSGNAVPAAPEPEPVATEDSSTGIPKEQGCFNF
jgi:DNA ligase (NAD+)